MMTKRKPVDSNFSDTKWRFYLRGLLFWETVEDKVDVSSSLTWDSSTRGHHPYEGFQGLQIDLCQSMHKPCHESETYGFIDISYAVGTMLQEILG